uniref:Uncharacterized protein n=1 Tax=Rhizophora mucronata TaxID=61149 RepID=A0A2P2PGB7_RHIMU
MSNILVIHYPKASLSYSYVSNFSTHHLTQQIWKILR